MYFSQVKDSYKRGKIIFPLEDISLGKHRIQIKVSDNYNNISTKEVVFIIDDNFKANITELMNYPNPFNETTTFKFNNGYEGEPLEMSLNIYDLRGKIVYSIEKDYEVSPPVIDNLSWNGKDLNGYTLSQGIYIYKLHVRNKSNNRTEIIHSKLLKLR